MVDKNKIRLAQVLQNQVPDFVNDDFPLFKDFLRQYQESLEYPGAPQDILQNIDNYINLDVLLLTPQSTTLTNDADRYTDSIEVVSTEGFPSSYGLLKIDDEIITYTSKTSTTFEGCVRGFSGISEYGDEIIFSESVTDYHYSFSTVENLSALFLNVFLSKLKKQVSPGFESRELSEDLNSRLFYKQISDFYSSKGTEEGFKILFNALYNKKVEIIRPSDSVFEASASSNRRVRDLVLEALDNDVDYTDLILNRTIYQRETNSQDLEEPITAYGTITNVERIQRGTKTYYIASLDNDYDKDISVAGTVFGKFEVTASTRVTEDYEEDAEGNRPSVLHVDSCIGFDASRNLNVYYEDGTVRSISVGDNSVNEFYRVESNNDIPRGSLISSKRYGYVTLDDESTAYFRITSVLSDLIPDDNSYFFDNDPVKFNTLGLKDQSKKYNDWTYNVATTYNIDTISLVSEIERKYFITLQDGFDITLNDRFFLKSSTGESYDVQVVSRNDLSTYVIISSSRITDFDSTLKTFTLERKLNKANFRFFPEANEYASDVQNIYRPKDLRDELFVTSSSIPNYSNEQLTTNDRRITFSVSLPSNQNNKNIKIGADATPTVPEKTHSFYTGDSIIYSEPEEDDFGDPNTNKLSIPNGRYYVTVVDNKTIKLSTSLNRVYSKEYITVEGSVTNNTFYYSDYSDIERVLNLEEPFTLKSKRIVKRIIPPVDQIVPEETKTGKIGILRNGVEILNYKSKNNIFYGELEDIFVLSGGEGYDITSPPALEIFDGENADGVANGGINASGDFVIKGSIVGTNVINGGFNYIDAPTVKISGANGSNCDAIPVMETYTHEVKFDASTQFGVGITTDTIITLSNHYFYPGEKVLYDTFGRDEIGGLKNKSIYYVGVIDNTSFTLHNNERDAENLENRIDLTAFGVGDHKLVALQKKKKLSEIRVTNSSKDFTYRKVSYDPNISSVPIDVYSNNIIIPNHGFSSGEIVVYNASTTPISGLTSSSSYYVTKVDDNRFKLSDIGIGNTLSTYYYDNNIYKDLTTFGVGRQYFKYPEITVEVTPSKKSIYAVSPQVEPVARGTITNVFLENKGVGYGCTNIINYNRQPRITAEPGKLASVKPFIVNGVIEEVIIQNVGQNYSSNPSIEIYTDGNGYGAELIPVISNGVLSDVIVKNGGYNYNDSTEIEIVSAGSGAKFQGKITKWNINEVERNLNSNQIYDDDGFIYQDSTTTLDDAEEYGILQYGHCYVPRKLRSSLYNKKVVDGRTIFSSDLILDNLGRETDSDYHSPIIGWAYDGNPIYGPFGYANPDGTGGIKRMVSGYSKRNTANRPSVTDFPLGFFVNDYEWLATGDLDIHNGRFCVTPEYPKGIYAYFSTLGTNDAGFKNYKLPAFPYFIGNTFKSKVIDFNYDSTVTQSDFIYGDIKEDYKNYDLLRNIQPYNISSPYGKYEYLFNPSDNTDFISKIKKVSSGTVTDINIFEGGRDFKVGDKITFEYDPTLANRRPLAKVVSIGGTEVSSVSIASSSIYDVEVINTSFGQALGIYTSQHNLSSGLANILNTEENTTYDVNLEVRQKQLVLSGDIGQPSQTGIVTYFGIYGLKSSKNEIPILSNDVFKIKRGNFYEEIKILNIDSFNSRLRVQREINGTIGTSYSAGTKLDELPRKFIIQNNDFQNTKIGKFNSQFYFNPQQSVGVGIGTTISVSNPGAGSTQRFIAGNRIYLAGNTLEINDVIYYDYDSNPIRVESFGDDFNLVKNKPYYAVPFQNGLIGISSRPVGFGSTGIVGIGSETELLTFTSFGVGDNHSFKTDYDNLTKLIVSTYEATVETTTDHNLSANDLITFECKSSAEKTIKIAYNQQNKKFGTGLFAFISSDVDTQTNIITINNHGLRTGQKVILESDSAPGGLVNNGVYYVLVHSQNEIKLSIDGETTKNISTQSFGRLIVVNPPLTLEKNKTLKFDLSDPSLSYVRSNIRYPAFTLKFFYDENLRHEFISSKLSNALSVRKSGRIGIDVDANVKLVCDDNFPSKLYYKLDPIKDNVTPFTFTQLLLDSDYENSISIVESPINGDYVINTVTDKTFRYKLNQKPDSSSYVKEIDSLSYSAISTTASGPINEVDFVSSGFGLIKLPRIKEVITENGIDEILFARSTTIGKVKDIDISDIGFDFPSDTTLRPRAFSPSVFKIDPLTSVESIEIEYPGKNYTVLPDLVMLDGYTNKVVDDLVLDYVENEDFEVKIIKNTKNLYDVEPKLIPINNSNGYKILNLTYDSGSKDATITLDVVGFSTLSAWPFPVGSQFMIEGVVTINPDTDEGYNTSDYDYKALFTVKTADPNIGGQLPSFTFNMSDFVVKNNPGVFNLLFTSARVIPQSYFPRFIVNRTPNKFFVDELITNGTTEDIVVSWEIKNEILKVFTSTPELYKIGDFIVGKTSKSSGTLTEVIGITTLTYELDASNAKRNRFYDKKGFLNEETQRIHDSDYYQYFSYSIKSEVGIGSWSDPVESLIHPSGMKKFSDLQVISVSDDDSEMVGIQTGSGFTGIADIDSYYNLNCVHDIDIATENNILNKTSDEIRFNSLALVDYFESIGNRVLIVDDISDEFNSNPRPTAFVTVDTFSLDKYRSKKYILFTNNKKFPGERQMIIVNVIHNGTYGFLTQYGLVETNTVQGYFDIGVFERNGLLLFYPVEFRFTDYNVSGHSYAAAESIAGISTQYIGDIANVGVQTVTIPQGTSTATKIVGIDSSYTSSKVIVTLEATDLQYFQYDEFNIVHDGTEIYETEFSTLATDNFSDQDVSLGIGTYGFRYNGNEIEMTLAPSVGLSTNYKVFSTVVSISDTSRVSSGTSTYNNTLTTVGFGSTTVDSTPNPIEIATLESKYQGFNVYASIEDIAYDVKQFSEIIVVHNGTNAYVSEFGVTVNDEDYEETGIGTFSASVDSSTKETTISFHPLASTGADREIEVRLLINSLGPVDLGISTNRLQYVSGEFSTLYGDYTGTENDVKRSFELRHQGDLIFERTFDASALNTSVSTDENVLILPNHFFVTGELVKYTYDPEEDTAIGIETASVAGIGTTDKLPTNLYVIKVNDSKIKLTDTAEKALKFNSEPLILASAGIGTQHKITATNKDTKGIFTIDNMMQSPLVKVGIKTTLSEDIALTDTLINTTGITSFFSQDIIKINDEIMRIDTVGVGSDEKIRVRRPWMGTELGIHTAGDLVEKLTGNYTIVGSTINFAAPPYGKVPVTPDLNQFGVPFVDPSDRDYTGITTNSYFHGRTFMRSGIEDETFETYTKNYIFDDISSQFTGIRTAFTLTTDEGSNVTGVSTDNAIILIKDIFQQPKRLGVSSIVGNYELTEPGAYTNILFEPTTQTPGEDVNSSNVPVGGVIVNIGSTTGLGYQPLVAAGGTATISGFGSITAISIGNSGSGYRPGIQTHINVFAETPSDLSIIGYATALNGHITGVAITNPGTAYTSTNPPRIRFDSPLSYTNIPLIYANDSVQGIGTKASLDIFVSRDTTIGEFKFNNNGYAYGQGEILTVAIGGSTGIPTDTSKVFDEFQVTVSETHSDEFSAWSLGQLQQLDSLDDRFDGVRRVFPISFQGERLSIRARPGSNIDVSATVLVFINDILQVPNQSYTFKGGSLLIFSEPIPKEYTSRIIFYRGTRDVDVVEVDIVEPIEVGDTVQLQSDSPGLTEDHRSVEDILTSDIILTNPYSGIGRVDDESFERPIMACKQEDDVFINGEPIGKDRNLYEPYISPVTNLIQPLGINTTIAWVENVTTFFDNRNENLAGVKLGQVEFISQDYQESGLGTVTVSAGGSITSVSITNAGAGYTFNPEISIGTPGAGGTTAIATCVVTNGSITSINVTDGGSGYISTQKPYVLIEPPLAKTELVKQVTYDGDFGSIISIANTSVVGIATTALKLGLYVPHYSPLRNDAINNSGFVTTGVSGILTDYYFTTSEVTVGKGVTSLYNDGSVLGIVTQRGGNVFQAYDINRTTAAVPGVGTTDILEVTTLIKDEFEMAANNEIFSSTEATFDSDSSPTFDGDGTVNSRDFGFYGNFSWGRLDWDPNKSRKQPRSFEAYPQDGYAGLSTSSIVKRVFHLRSKLYTQYSE